MRSVLKIFLFTLFFGYTVNSVSAYYSPGNPTNFVNDFANVLSVEQEDDLNNRLRELEKATSAEVAIVTVDSLKGDTVENFAVKLFEEWKIGKEDKDNGILILSAIEDREVRIEVGYGLEPTITDAQSYWIIQNEIIPNYKAGDYYKGLLNSTTKISSAISNGEVIPSSTNSSEDFEGYLMFIIFAVVMGSNIIIWIFSIMARTKSWWFGGVVGGILGVILGNIIGPLLLWFLLLTVLGLFYDRAVSKAYKENIKKKQVPWWAGGNNGFGEGTFRSSGGSGSSFGGFGGGSSGGGGASGKW